MWNLDVWKGNAYRDLLRNTAPYCTIAFIAAAAGPGVGCSQRRKLIKVGSNKESGGGGRGAGLPQHGAHSAAPAAASRASSARLYSEAAKLYLINFRAIYKLSPGGYWVSCVW